MQKFILCLCLLMLGFTTPRAHAEPQSPYKTLITHDEFKALSRERQMLYVEGLQTLFREWAVLQSEDQEMRYQNASTARPGALDFFSALFAEARAAEQRRACIYAGWISNVDDSGRFCQSPSRCDQPGKKNWVQCNPLVFGPGVCAPQGGTASKSCQIGAKSAEDIRSYILSHKQEFMNLRRELESVCPNVKNPTVCMAIQFRVSQMYDFSKDQLESVPASAPTASTGARPVRVSQRPPTGRPTRTGFAGDADGSTAPPPLPAAEILPADGAQPARPNVAARPPTRPQPARPPASQPSATEVSDTLSVKDCPAFGNKCEATALMQPMAGPQDSSWAGKTLMSLEQAQAFYCRTEPVNPQFLNDVRSFLRTQKARVRNTSVTYDNCKEKRNKQNCIRETNKYYQCYFSQMEANFEACVQTANANRAASRIPNESAVGAILVERTGVGGKPVIDFKLTGGSQQLNTITVEPYLGLLFGMYKVDLCKVQKSAAPSSGGAAPAASGGVSSSSPATGSAAGSSAK